MLKSAVNLLLTTVEHLLAQERDRAKSIIITGVILGTVLKKSTYSIYNIAFVNYLFITQIITQSVPAKHSVEC